MRARNAPPILQMGDSIKSQRHQDIPLFFMHLRRRVLIAGWKAVVERMDGA